MRSCLLWWRSTSSHPLDAGHIAEIAGEIFTGGNFFPTTWHWENYAYARVKGNFNVYFLNSLIYSACTLAGVVLFSQWPRTLLPRRIFPARKCCSISSWSMMVPIPGAFIPLYVLLIKLNLANTMTGLILPYINSGPALGIFILKGFFEEIPKEIQEAAKIDGCGVIRIYWTSISLWQDLRS